MSKHDSHTDAHFMQRALDLALNGQGFVSPNPMVGCVVVHNRSIIGEGWHKKYGEAHAEVNAVNSVIDKTLLRESTVYVCLEPCAHFGKTPPCADMLVSYQVQRVVISNVDANPLVGGKGIEKLKAAGIDVTVGILEESGRILNRRFFTQLEKQRPFVILKWAQTADGFIARENLESKWISNVYSRQLTHKWRTEEDAIMVGTTTAAIDDPQLTVRDWSGRNPIRIVIDRSLKLMDTLKLFDGTSHTLRYNLQKSEARTGSTLVKLKAQGFLTSLLSDLQARKIQSVLVEGGATTLNAFISEGIWDEARVFQSHIKFGKGVTAPMLSAPFEESSVMGDKLRTYTRS